MPWYFCRFAPSAAHMIIMILKKNYCRLSIVAIDVFVVIIIVVIVVAIVVVVIVVNVVVDFVVS
jgi:hypothetical protein